MRSTRSTPHRARRDDTPEDVHDSTVLEDFADDYGRYVDAIQPTVECGTPPKDPGATRALRNDLLRRAPQAQRALGRSGHRVRVRRRPGYEAVPEPDSLAAIIIAHEHPAFSDPRDPLASARTVSDHLHIALGKLHAKLPPGTEVAPVHQDTSVVLRLPGFPNRRRRTRLLVAITADLYAVWECATSGLDLVLRILDVNL